MSRGELLYEIADYAIAPHAPVIPLPKDINVELLARALGKASSDDLVFDTRPIGKITESRNGRFYAEASVLSLVKQVNEKRPEGRWGHLSDAEAGTVYEEPAIRCVAAEYVQETGTVWGKFILLTPEAERHILAARATNSKVGTSIYAFNPIIENKQVVDYDLITIDLANAERVGIRDMSTVPNVSKEMKEDLEMGENTQVVAENSISTTPAIVTNAPAMSMDNALAIIKVQTVQLREAEEVKNNMRLIAECLAVDPTDVVTRIQSLRGRVSELESENSRLLSENIIAVVSERVPAETVRPIVAELVRKENPTTRQGVANAVDKVLGMELVKKVIDASVVKESGPVVVAPVKETTVAPVQSVFE